ncbi:MAG: S41 family peptidase [Candidatus Obscuribacterales bacterium]|nr:S41 family peptidase [Candidatus Obscuribacterales bacterium]
MRKKLRYKVLLSLPIVLSISLGGANLISRADDVSPKSGRQLIAQHVVNPQHLYSRVWGIISNEYYDQNFNDQDWKRWEHRYDGKLKTLDDAHKAIETMLASLGDKYTRFLDKEAFSDEKQQIDAHLFGVGIQIGMDKSQRIIVIAPIDNTPASHAGVQAGDEIAEVDGKSTKGLSVEEAAKAIKGEKGTEVALTLVRKGERLKMKMVRDEIHINSIQSAKMLDSEVGYIRLTSFISRQADKEMKDALKELSGAKAIVLDLRDNPGGLLTNAIEISNMFLDGKNNIVSTVDADGYKTPAVSDGNPVTRQPLAVLINKGSASASEIASGALKDNGRAILVGQTTFGKGLVQGIKILEDLSGVNYTIARYLTPSDTDINKKGIAPDIAVELSQKDYEDGKGPWWLDPDGPAAVRKPEDLKDIQLAKAVEALKNKLNDKVVLNKADASKNSSRGN